MCCEATWSCLSRSRRRYDLLSRCSPLFLITVPLTKFEKDLKQCAQVATAEDDKTYFEQLCSDAAFYETEILAKRKSLMDVLSQHTTVALPCEDFLVSLPPMRVRQYSISSSPLSRSDTCTVTFGVIDSPAMANGENMFEGVTTTYLSNLGPGDSLQVSVRPSAKKTFCLPADEKHTPMMMFCAGTGLAPFRGFIQQRAVQMKANPDRELAPALLFVGCRSPTKDRLYAQEIDEWVKQGVVHVMYAFSREKEASEGCVHVSDRMVREKDKIIKMWRMGGRAYVCGSRAFGATVREAARAIATDVAGNTPQPDQVERFMNALQERVATDIFD